MKRFLLSLFLVLTLAIPAAAQSLYPRMSNLPCVYINTFDGWGIYSKTDYVYATLHYVDEADEVTSYDSIQIRGRGNSTWGLPKKPYRIKFLSKQKFLGKGHANAKSWTLLANAGDKTMIRNAVTSEIGSFLGLPFNPSAKFADFVLNDSYQGTYQISDQVEVRKKRVDIMEQDYPIADESNITGGYLLEADGFADGLCFRTRKGAIVTIHYPDEDEIDPTQTQYIEDYVKSFENVLFSKSYADPENGYRPLVDSTSLSQWYIATEISGNVDGFWSTYFYKEQDDPRLFWGPLWDYDIAYGNDDRNGDTRESLMADMAYDGSKAWVVQMWKDPWFARLINRTYKTAIDSGIVNYALGKVDSLVQLLEQSKDLNYEKWGIDKKFLRERVLYSSYDQYVEDLKEYISHHCTYLTTTFAARDKGDSGTDSGKDPAPEPEPDLTFKPEQNYYRIESRKATISFDLNQEDNDTTFYVVAWANTPERLSQDWRITPVNGYYFIQNRVNGMALLDPTEGVSTETTNTGAFFQLSEPDSLDDRQLWTIVPQGSQGYYNIENKASSHTANLNGGFTDNGTAIMSYITDDRNASSGNRLWKFNISDPLPKDTVVTPVPKDSTIVPGPQPGDSTVIPEPQPGDSTVVNPDTIVVNPDTIVTPKDTVDVGIRSIEPRNYALAYNPQSRELHFAAEDPAQLTFTAAIFTTSGEMVRRFPASERHSVADLSRGTYIIVWHVSGKRRSCKLIL